MKKRTLTKGMLMAALICGCVQWGGTAVHAAELQEFTLDPMVVTAQRMETRDLDTPATVTVVNAKKIEDAGYKNVFDAIEHQVGLSSTGYGDAGQDFGFSSGRTVIRGFDRGTLVMVDGIPMNLKNYNSLDGIPIDMVERIEIVKGAASTLYGSEAMGGVVNIITKTPSGSPKFKIKGTIGNYYKDWGLTYSGEKLILSVAKEYSDSVDKANDYPAGSTTDWWNGKGQKDRLALAAKLNEELAFNFMYQEGDITRGGYDAVKNKSYSYSNEDKRLTTGLSYVGKDNGVSATVGYNYREVDGWDFVANTKTSSNAEMCSWIGDVQKEWDFGGNSLIAGYSFKRENYDGLVKKANKAHRIDNSIYLSYNHKFSDKFSTTVGIRGELIDDPVKDQEVVNPQFQTLYKVNENTSWYTNIGKAFQMPTVDSYYDKKPDSSSLKPEEGWTYETGIKKIFDDSSVKLAIYHMEFENKIGWTDKNKDPQGIQYAYNKGDFRNTGVEVEYVKIIDDNWSYNLGLGYGNPEIKDPSGNSGWVQDSGRIDVAASLTYSAEKLRSTLSWKYLGDREAAYYKSRGDVPSRNRLTWNTSYDITKNDTITLTLNNLSDKVNYANKYGNLDLPFNWRVMYTHTF
ncbi:MAG: TonB-dependent receptor [Phascolarctobacterium sp.]|nr:TonB-dependent receptor [Phascolarctobacterium sp.]